MPQCVLPANIIPTPAFCSKSAKIKNDINDEGWKSQLDTFETVNLKVHFCFQMPQSSYACNKQPSFSLWKAASLCFYYYSGKKSNQNVNRNNFNPSATLTVLSNYVYIFSHYNQA